MSIDGKFSPEKDDLPIGGGIHGYPIFSQAHMYVNKEIHATY